MSTKTSKTGKKPEVLLIIPPMMQFNAAYPSVPVLTSFLREHGYKTSQSDAGLELFLHLFSKKGLQAVRRQISQQPKKHNASVKFFTANFSRYLNTIEYAVKFLQTKNPRLAPKIAGRSFLPEGPRFNIIRTLPSPAWLNETMHIPDQALYLTSLYIDDLTDAIRYGIDERFELSRYAEKLAVSLNSFARLNKELSKTPTLIDKLMDNISSSLLKKYHPDVIGFTIPFPGSLYPALRMAKKMKRLKPSTGIILGGGYINTELRQLRDPHIFDLVDYITLDDGEAPLLQIVRNIGNPSPAPALIRTFIRKNGKVIFCNAPHKTRTPSHAPALDGMNISRRISMMELPNPMHRLWSDGKWNKLMLAHGCYWHKCAFCDTSLDYIRKYQPANPVQVVNVMESIISQTGQPGFHFVDEAAPPALLKAICHEILRRKLNITWWCNIRFEKTFTPGLIKLMADAGCIAVTGGLETACNRTLSMMNKGITVEKAVKITSNFAARGIMTHLYLMYGFPSQTTQETMDALEIVRQMFEKGIVQSAYWHRFALTVHSAMAQNPSRFGIKPARLPRATFARNEIPYKDLRGSDPAPLAYGLRKAVYNFMHNTGTENDPRSWFEIKVPRPRVKPNFVANKDPCIHAHFSKVFGCRLDIATVDGRSC